MKFKSITDVAFRAEQRLELERARKKFPGRQLTMVALTEEVGELAKALLDESPARIVEEAIQVAVMAQRIATEGDDSVNRYRGWVPNWPALEVIQGGKAAA